MTRRTSKHGTTYTEGSQSTRGTYPKVCAAGDACLHGGKVVLAHDPPLWFEWTPEHGERSWHVVCRRAARAAA